MALHDACPAPSPSQILDAFRRVIRYYPRPMRHAPLILGSASARRQKILRGMGVDFDVLVPGTSEVTYADAPRRTALENAVNKNLWCAEREPGRVILTADTVIDFAGRCIPKPSTRKEAAHFLRNFSGNRHAVLTAVVLSWPDKPILSHVEQSVVVFRSLSDSDITRYLSKVNPLDKAGAYDIDQHGDLIVESFTGSRTSIMGLPSEKVLEWLSFRGFLISSKGLST